MIFFKCFLNKRPETTDLTKYLQADAEFAINSILTSDRKKTVAQQVLPLRFHDKQVKSLRVVIFISDLNSNLVKNNSTCEASDIYTATFILFYQEDLELHQDLSKLLARITPILNVSPACSQESAFYLENLISNDEHPLWAIKSKSVPFFSLERSIFIVKFVSFLSLISIYFLYFIVLDSIGKISDGWFENTKSLCDALYLICQAMEEDSVIRKVLERYYVN